MTSAFTVQFLVLATGSGFMLIVFMCLQLTPHTHTIYVVMISFRQKHHELTLREEGVGQGGAREEMSCRPLDKLV